MSMDYPVLSQFSWDIFPDTLCEYSKVVLGKTSCSNNIKRRILESALYETKERGECKLFNILALGQ